MLCKGHTTFLLLCAHATTAALLPYSGLRLLLVFERAGGVRG